MRKRAGSPAASSRAPVLQDLRTLLRALDSGRSRRFREGLAELGMVSRAVVTLAVVLPDELPVASLDDRALMRHLRLAEAVRREIRLHRPAERCEIRGRLCKADEEVSGHALAGDRLESIGRLIETLGHLASEQEAPVKIVAPLVIGADEPHGCALLGGADPAAAMPAGVVESADRSFKIAHQDHRIFADLYGEEGAGLVELAVVPDEQPVSVPDHLHVEPEVAGVDVEGLRQGETCAAALEPSQHVVSRVHELVLD